MGGPIWLAEINDHNYVKQISDLIDAPDTNLVLASEKKIHGLLHGILNVLFIYFQKKIILFLS